MKRLLIIGCGDIARRTIPLLKDRYRIYALIRDMAQRDAVRAMGAIPVYGDLDDRKSLSRLAGLADAVLHFAPPPNDGECDTRTHHLLAALSRGTPPKRLIYISTSGVYGDCRGELVSETHPLNPESARAMRRMDAEQRIREWAERNRVNAVMLRVPGIYAASRLPLERLRSGTPAIVSQQDSHTNHIHADDLARVCVAALRYGKPCRAYHASDDSELKMGDYFDAVANAFGLPRPPRLPRDAVERAVSPALWSFMNESRRMTNRRMKQELKVRLRYPTVHDALCSDAAGITQTGQT
ncbi:MAG TPA: SDR family oxidoreductase [Gallionella sp.]|nr:SDR family oxidoreductase [Gallionella sp.]